MAADLIRRLGAGEIADPDDVPAIAAAMESMVDRWAADGLPDVALPEAERDRLSRRARTAEMVSVLKRVAAA
jgi:hypothetical protein